MPIRVLILILSLSQAPQAFAAKASKPTKKAPTPLCDSLLASAQAGLIRPQVELAVFNEGESTGIFAYMGYDNGNDDADKPIGGVEFKVTGKEREILRMIHFQTKPHENFGDVGKLLLTRALAMNPQVRVVREVWTGRSMQDWVDSLQEDLTPTQALERSPRTKIYAELGFRISPSFYLHFDRSEDTLEVNVDFRRVDR